MASATLTRSYDDIIQAAEAFYGQDYWQNRYNTYISQGIDAGQTIKDMYNELEAAGEITALRNQNGDVVMWYSNATSPTTPSTPGYDLNSNLGGGTASQQNTASLNIPMQTEKNPTTGKMETKPVQTFTNGLPDANSVKMVAGNTVQAIGAVASGISIGKSFDQRLYDANPSFWNDIGWESLNPQTWKTLTSDMGPAGKTAVNFLLGLKDDDTAQPYMNDELFAYYMYGMSQAGIFNKGDEKGTYDFPASGSYRSYLTQPITYVDPVGAFLERRREQYQYSEFYQGIASVSGSAPVYAYIEKSSRGINRLYLISESSFTAKILRKTVGNPPSQTNESIDDRSSTASAYNINGVSGYYYYLNVINYSDATMVNMYPSAYCTSRDDNGHPDEAFFIHKYGDVSGGSAIDGVEDQPNATLPNTSGWDTPENTLQSLKNQYPNLWDNRAEQNVYDPDTDTTKKITYIPVAFPNGGTGDRPTNNPDKKGGSQLQPTIDPTPDDPNSTPDPTILTLILSLTERLESILKNPTPMTNPETDPSPDNPVPQGDITLNPDPNPPDTGGGSSPVPIPPTGNASSLWKVYHPSQATIDAFGAWLWSSNFVEQIKKMFNDPMSAIIGLHKIFAPPVDAGTANIKVGYLDSGVASAYVDQQYVTIDCGSITLREYFGNVFDYEPYTRVAIYLPFIGVQSLSTAEVMRSTINVVYHVDIFTGACLAEVYISRDGGRGCLYTFSGDCSARYPLSSGSYMGIVGGVLSIAGGIAGTVATGGNLLPALLGASSAMTHMHTDVKHSGQISGNAGAMGVKTPFLIVLRPQTAMANSYEHFTGRPANKFALIGEASGYIKCKEVHVDNLSGASDKEKEMVASLLKSGIIV